MFLYISVFLFCFSSGKMGNKNVVPDRETAYTKGSVTKAKILCIGARDKELQKIS